MINKIKDLLLSLGAAEVGFAKIDELEEYPGLTNSISLIVPLSDAIIDTIDTAPTHTYFHHYRSVNALIDHMTLRAGLMLSQNGYRYVCIPASQSIEGFSGLMSHKYAAVRAGLGIIGKNALFLSEKYGPRVRLGTILTDCDLSEGFKPIMENNLCSGCNICVKACPALALSGKGFNSDTPEEKLIDAAACSKFMKEKFQRIGRGAVCGICMRVCPASKTR